MPALFEIVPGPDNYCVVGNPVAHSKSPFIHQAFARQTRQSIDYRAVEIDPEGFDVFLDTFVQAGGKGLNVTLPFKQKACNKVANLTSRAARCGSVNTIWIDDAGLTQGDTTDGRGLVRDMITHGIELAGRKILILGAGGAVRAVISDLFENGIAEITLANRTAARAQELVEHFNEYRALRFLPMDELALHRFDILINGTSASLQGQLPSMPADLQVTGKIVYDMAYADGDTVFVQWAYSNGAVMALDGLGMLVEQAAESFYIWRGVRPDTKPVIEMLRKVKS